MERCPERAGDAVGPRARPQLQRRASLQRSALLQRSTSMQWTQHSVLQEQRAKVVPPLPRVFVDLRQATPRFREAEPRPQRVPRPFPQFAALAPLALSAGNAPGGPVAGAAAAAPSASAAPATSAASSSLCPGTGSAGSSAAGSASSGTAPAAASSGASTDVGTGGTLGGALRVGVVYAGEARSLPAHPVNVVAGLFAYLSAVAPGSRILGFQDGPSGLLAGHCRELTKEEIWGSLNQGGLQLLRYGTCSEGGFTAAERAEEARQAAAVCAAERLDSLVVIAGPKDLSWAAALAVCFVEAECATTIVGVPHSKNLNLYVPRFMPISLGFDSARRMLSEVAGNIFVDSLSSKKYWHFIRCGADALTMEVALQTRCTFSVLTMERRKKGGAAGDVLEERMSLQDAVDRLKEVIEERRAIGRPSGVVLVSEKIIETLPEMEKLKRELVELLGDVNAATAGKPPSIRDVERQLKSESARQLFKRLPRVVQMSLILNRDSAGLPLLPTDLEGERLLGRFVQQALQATKAKGSLVSFAPRFHVVDLMSNAPLPSPFDCAFGYLLGHTAAALVCERRTFYVATCANMHLPVEEWAPHAVPFSFLYPTTAEMQAHALYSEDHPADAIPKTGWLLRKNLVEAYRHFREAWVECNAFKSPGPMQFGDGGEVGPQSERPVSLLAEYLSLDELKQMIQPTVALPPPLRVSLEPLVMRDIRVLENLSLLEQQRLSYAPALPQYLRSPIRAQVEDIVPHACCSTEELSQSFPFTHAQVSAVQIVPFSQDGGAPATAAALQQPQHSPRTRSMKVGVVFSSNQVPGFHNVVAGLFDYLQTLSAPSELVGYLCGLEGLVKGRTMPIDKSTVDQYRNLGGQDLLCQFGDPPSLGFKDHLRSATMSVAKHQLDGLVLIGNLESQVDAAFVAEACAAEHLSTRVVGVPVSIDCNFPFVQQTVGYDTICRTLSAYIGNIGSMAETSGNRWIFVRIIGDAWSHVAVECTLQTQPNLVLLSGSMLHGQCMAKIVECICDVIVTRHEAGCDYGVVLIPLGFVADITEMRLLFGEIMEIMNSGEYETSWDSIPNIATKLKPQMAALFDVIPRDVQYEICFGGRERGTNKIDLTVISTDRLMMRFVEIELQRRRQLGLFKEDFFHGSCCPMVYQARSANPTNFDCDLAYALGWGAGALVQLGKSGLLVHASGLELGVDEWRLSGLPLTCLLTVEKDEETNEQRIRPGNVQLLKQRGIVRPFVQLPNPEVRDAVYHGPVQYYGGVASHPSQRTTWYMENMPIQDPTDPLREIARLCSTLQSTMAQARAESTLYAVNSLLSNALSVLESYRNLSESSRTTGKSLADVPIEQVPRVWRTKVAKAPTARSWSKGVRPEGHGDQGAA